MVIQYIMYSYMLVSNLHIKANSLSLRKKSYKVATGFPKRYRQVPEQINQAPRANANKGENLGYDAPVGWAHGPLSSAPINMHYDTSTCSRR